MLVLSIETEPSWIIQAPSFWTRGHTASRNRALVTAGVLTGNRVDAGKIIWEMPQEAVRYRPGSTDIFIVKRRKAEDRVARRQWSAWKDPGLGQLTTVRTPG